MNESYEWMNHNQFTEAVIKDWENIPLAFVYIWYQDVSNHEHGDK